VYLLLQRGQLKNHVKEKTMSKRKSPMTKAAAQRIQSATAKKNGGKTPKGSFGARAQSLVARNLNKD